MRNTMFLSTDRRRWLPFGPIFSTRGQSVAPAFLCIDRLSLDRLLPMQMVRSWRPRMGWGSIVQVAHLPQHATGEPYFTTGVLTDFLSIWQHESLSALS